MTRLRDAGAQLPVFWYTLHENENASGFGLTLKDKQTLQTQYYPAFYAYRDLTLVPASTSAPTPTAPTATPPPTCTFGATPTPTPTPSPTPAASSSPIPTPTPTFTPTPTPTQRTHTCTHRRLPNATPTPSHGAGIVFCGASTTVNHGRVHDAGRSTSRREQCPATSSSLPLPSTVRPLRGARRLGADRGRSRVCPNPKLYSYYRVAGSAEPASYTWGLSSAAAAASVSPATPASTTPARWPRPRPRPSAPRQSAA